MMPAAQLKMLQYMRSSEPKGASNTDALRSPNGPGGSPKSPPSPSGMPHAAEPAQPAQHQQQQLPPTPSARQLLAEAAKFPVPTSLRGTTSGLQQPNSVLPKAATVSPKQQQRHHEPLQGQPSFQHTRSNSDTIRLPLTQQQQQQQQQIWEESSINSMFTDSVTPSARQSQRMHPSQYGRTFPQQPQMQNRHQDHRQQLRYEQAVVNRGMEEDVGAPLLVGDRGVLRNLPTGANGYAVDDPYEERDYPAPFGSPTRHAPALKHTKYALRDARGRLPPESHTANHVHGRGGGSPEHKSRHRSEGLAKTNGKLPPLPAGQAKNKEREAFSPRLLFREADVQAGGRAPELLLGTDNDSDLPSQDDEATTNQHTPRQARSPPRPVPQQPPLAVPQKRVLRESSLPHNGLRGRRDKQPPPSTSTSKETARKRQHSPDYDDSALHTMSYAVLREEPFDHDPARVAVQAAKAAAAQSYAVPGSTLLADAPLEERLRHYKSKDGNSQHQFFTELPVQEWDECGDWFLEQFAELTSRIRAQRQAKRRTMAAFEAEIAEREQTVRRKAESIERTLDELKHEGEGMMRGKVIDL